MNYYARCAMMLLSSISFVSSTLAMEQITKAFEQALWGHGHIVLTGLKNNTLVISTDNTDHIHLCERAIDSFIGRSLPKELVELLQLYNAKGILNRINGPVYLTKSNNFIVDSFITSNSETEITEWLRFCKLKSIQIEPVVATKAKNYINKRKQEEFTAALAELSSRFDHITQLKENQKLSNELGASGADSDDEGYKDFTNLVRTMCKYGSKQRAPVTGNNNNNRS